MSVTRAPLILASASLRRTEILDAHDIPHVVIPSDVDEALPEDADFTPEQTTIYLAELKADAVLAGLDPADWPQGCYILGTDTIVYKDHIIGKPVDEEDALNILRSLNNTSHEVISGVCLISQRLRTANSNARKSIFSQTQRPYASTTIQTTTSLPTSAKTLPTTNQAPTPSKATGGAT